MEQSVTYLLTYLLHVCVGASVVASSRLRRRRATGQDSDGAVSARVGCTLDTSSAAGDDRWRGASDGACRVEDRSADAESERNVPIQPIRARLERSRQRYAAKTSAPKQHSNNVLLYHVSVVMVAPLWPSERLRVLLHRALSLSL